jgi:F-box/WD-40 domain protein 10
MIAFIFYIIREVLCLEFLYLRILTGCADGKIRIWSTISGQCLRVMRGNSLSDPVTSLTATPNRFVSISIFNY